MILDTNINIESYFKPDELNELKEFVEDNLNYIEKNKLSSTREKLLSKRNRHDTKNNLANL